MKLYLIYFTTHEYDSIVSIDRYDDYESLQKQIDRLESGNYIWPYGAYYYKVHEEI